jgi:hypothetical protein
MVQTKRTNRHAARTRKQRGGIRCTPLIQENISSLIHGTSLSAVEKIVESGYLKSRPGNARMLKGQRMNRGVYFQPMFKCNTGKQFTEANCSRPIILVFSNVLMDMYDDYHITTVNCAGTIFAPASNIPGTMRPNHKCEIRSYNKSQLEQYFSDNTEELCASDTGFTQNEIAFYDNIGLEHLQEVWICDFKGLFRQWRSRIAPPDNALKRNMIREQAILDFDPEEARAKITEILSEKYSHIPVKLITVIPEKTFNQGCA